MEIPKGFEVKGSTQRHALSLIYNLYGAKDAGRTYYLFMVEYLKSLGFRQSTIDPCVFYYKQLVLLMYVDDFIIAGPTINDINDAFEIISDNVDLEWKGDVCDYVGVHFERNDKSIVLSQPHLIQSIIEDLHLDRNSKSAPTPSTGNVLHADIEGDDFDNHFNYRSVIGKLNYLEKSTRPDIGYAVHQCARFMSNPKQSHAKAIKRIGRYLLGTMDKGLILKPDENKSFECFVDASFAGEWIRGNEDKAMYDPNTARSRTGYIIRYAGIPLTWASKLQQEVSLSSTEAEMIALSAATRENIYLMRLIRDAAENSDLHIRFNKCELHCSIFEDNISTLTMAKDFRIRPRTKHINVKYWHFLQFMDKNKGIISLHWISTKEQLADIMTKALPVELHQKFTYLIMGWEFTTTNHK